MVHYFRSPHAPSSAPGGLVWDTPDSIVGVEDSTLAYDLSRMPDGRFVEVLPWELPAGHEGFAPMNAEPSPAPANEPAGPAGDSGKPRGRRGRPEPTTTAGE